MGLLDLLQPVDDPVVLAVADRRRVLDVVGELGRTRLLGELGPLVSCILGGLAHGSILPHASDRGSPNGEGAHVKMEARPPDPGAEMSNLASNLVTTAQADPDGVAIRLDDAELTWSQLHGLAAKTAGSLRAAGLQPGDRVSLILPNVPAFPVLFYGTLLAGGVVVPMNPLLKGPEIEYFYTDSGATFSFVWGDFAAEAQAGAQGTDTQVIVSGPV